MKMQKVKAIQAAEWLYNLLQSKQWLLSGKVNAENTPQIIQESVAFLVSFSKHGAEDWQDVSLSARGMVSEMLNYLLHELVNPHSFFYHQTWQVERSLTDEQKVLRIVAHEIEHNLHQKQSVH